MKLKRILCLLLTGFMIMSMLQLPAAASDAYENTYVNSGNYRADLIGVARTQVGYRETMDNNTKYGQWYGLNYYPWCAMFVSWCARQANIPQSVLANSSFAEPGSEYFNVECKDGRTYTPVPGDLFFKRGFTHVGIVFHVEGDYFYSLEGNTNNDGSDNGTYAMCRKHRIADVYFGSYANSNIPAPAAPVVSTAKNTYTSGQTVRVQWEPVEDAVSYSAVVYKNGLVCASGKVGDETFFDFKSPQAGEYLVSVAAHYADGTAGFGQRSFYVSYAPSLKVRYNTNGGELAHAYQYVVIGGDGVDFRAYANTGAYRYSVIPTGTLLSADQIDDSGRYTWAKVTYDGKTGWCIVSDGYCQRVGYTQTDAGDMIQYPEENYAVTAWNAGSGEEKALLDPQTAGLWRENHAFVGWSKTADGSGTIFRQDQTDISAEQIDPSFAYGDKTVKMYAIWRKVVGEITIEKLPDKVQYVTDEKLDTTGLQIRVKYLDGAEEVVDSGFRFGSFDSGTTGTKKVRVHYYDATTEFEVTVNPRMQYEIEDGVAVITGYEGGSGVVIIPDSLEGVPVGAIGPGAFADCSQITGLTIPTSVTQIGDGAFSGCSSLSVVNYSGTKAQWDEIQIGEGNEVLADIVQVTGYQVMGDYNGDFLVDNTDVIYLLKHSLNASRFPVTTTADLNMDGKVDNDDVILLLKHSLNPDRFPLTAAMATATIEEPAEESVEEPVEESAGEPLEEPVEESAEESVEEPAENSGEESGQVPRDDL